MEEVFINGSRMMNLLGELLHFTATAIPVHTTSQLETADVVSPAAANKGRRGTM